MEHFRAYTFDDYRDGMPPRVFGSEMEYTTNNNVEEALKLNTRQSRLRNFVDTEFFVGGGRERHPSAVLSTGGEMYLDMGMLEYATPECESPHELVLHERAGEWLVDATVQKLARFTNAEMKSHVFKRSGYAQITHGDEVIREEQSVGYHENYTSINVFSVHANAAPIEKKRKLLSNRIESQCFSDYLALRKLIDGAGMVAKGHYSISQKPTAINYQDFESGTFHGQKRPFFQHGDRMEIRSSEGNMSDWVTEFKYGLTSLVIRLIEHDSYPKQFMLKNPNLAVRQLSRDPHVVVELQYGGSMKAIDVLKEIVAAGYELGQNFSEFADYEKKAVRDFERFYTDFQNINLPDNDVSALSDRIDWAARFEHLVNRGASYETFDSSNFEQVRDDLKWNMVNDRDIARRRFARFGNAALHVTIPEPPHTRAELRIKLAKEFVTEDRLRYITWDSIRTTDRKTYPLGGPFNLNKLSHYSERD